MVQLRSLLLAAVVAILCARSALCGQAPFAIKISSSHDGVLAGTGVERAGTPIVVFVAMTNNSSKVVSVPSLDREFYMIEVRNEQGNIVQETDEGRKMREAADAPKGRRILSGLNDELKPHETVKHTIEVSEYWDMSRPGKYTIQVERRLPEELGKGSVKSNTIAVTVTE